jgi:hypothetical protein
LVGAAGQLVLDLAGVRFVDAEPDVSATAVGQPNGHDGLAQRSRVTGVTVTFNAVVSLPADPAAAFRLTRTGPGGPTGHVALAVDLAASTAMQTVARLTLSGALTEFGSLIDGRYRLTVVAAQAAGFGQPLDGDANGVAGGDYRQIGDPYRPLLYFVAAVQWMDKHSPQDDELRRFRAEAAELLGIKD